MYRIHIYVNVGQQCSLNSIETQHIYYSIKVQEKKTNPSDQKTYSILHRHY